VIVGGMSLGTLMTLFVVPTVYTLLSRRRVASAVGNIPLPPELSQGQPAE
jgi:multidrug efflux pump